MMHSSRRDFLKGLLTAGAGAWFGTSNTHAQAAGGADRRIDVANPAATVAGLQNSDFSGDELRGIYRDNALKFLPKYA